jgi:hypothetical protein
MRDLFHMITVQPSILGAAALSASSTQVVGANSVDTAGYEGVTVVFRYHTRTAGSVLSYVQDSADGTTWAGTTTPAATDCIPASAVIGGALPAAASAAGSAVIGLTETGGTAAAPVTLRRYVRAVMIPTGYSGIVSADIILSHPKHRGLAEGGTQVVV